MSYFVSRDNFNESNDFTNIIFQISSTKSKNIKRVNFSFETFKRKILKNKKNFLDFNLSNFTEKRNFCKMVSTKLTRNMICYSKKLTQIFFWDYLKLNEKGLSIFYSKFHSLIITLILESKHIFHFSFFTGIIYKKTVKKNAIGIETGMNKCSKSFTKTYPFQFDCRNSKKWVKNFSGNLEDKLIFLSHRNYHISETSKNYELFSNKITFPLFFLVNSNFLFYKTKFRFLLFKYFQTISRSSSNLFNHRECENKKNNKLNCLFQIGIKKKFYFTLWNVKWNLEILLFNRILNISNWVFKKTEYLNKDNFLNSKFVKNNISHFHINSVFNFFISRFKILIQRHPDSFIIKARLLCKIWINRKPEETQSLLRIWIKDTQQFFHSHLLNFMVLFSDIVFSAPRINNIFSNSFSQITVNLASDDLCKIPQNLEKLLAYNCFNTNQFSNKFFTFISKFGLYDLYRKYFLKRLFYSQLKDQKI